jgi:hypothetical protein
MILPLCIGIILCSFCIEGAVEIAEQERSNAEKWDHVMSSQQLSTTNTSTGYLLFSGYNTVGCNTSITALSYHGVGVCYAVQSSNGNYMIETVTAKTDNIVVNEIYYSDSACTMTNGAVDVYNFATGCSTFGVISFVDSVQYPSDGYVITNYPTSEECTTAQTSTEQRVIFYPMHSCAHVKLDGKTTYAIINSCYLGAAVVNTYDNAYCSGDAVSTGQELFFQQCSVDVDDITYEVGYLASSCYVEDTGSNGLSPAAIVGVTVGVMIGFVLCCLVAAKVLHPKDELVCFRGVCPKLDLPKEPEDEEVGSSSYMSREEGSSER